MPEKMPKRLVALSASAITTVYLAGLFSTRTAVDNAVASATPSDTPGIPTPGSAGAATSTAVPVARPAVVVGASAPALGTQVSTGYADGSYTGTGSSRFGTVTVSVTTSGGKLTNVQITRVTTSYPVSRIASLPAQTIQKQSANINAVTGATASSQAFKQAVQQALSQALAANSTAVAG